VADDDDKTMLVDEDGKPLSEGSKKSAPVKAKAAPDKRLRDEDGKLLSEGDKKGPPVPVKAGGFSKRAKALYDNPRSKRGDDED
jgi:hypothetical protein